LICFGCPVEFRQESIWVGPMKVDFERPPDFRLDVSDPMFRRHEKLYMAMADAAGKDDFLVGQPCALPACDLLSAMLGGEEYLLALVDHASWIEQATMQLAEGRAQAFEYFRDRLAGRHDFWYGLAGWMPFWAPEPFHGTQSDVSCMMSPEMFDRFVLPELELLGRRFGAMWYHLDGGDASQHLPRLLSLPYMRVIQYNPAPFEPQNGPELLPIYRQIQAAGKIVHLALPVENVEPLVRSLDPRLTMLHVWCDTPASGRKLLEDMRGWTRG
jgi:hypothetical protein